MKVLSIDVGIKNLAFCLFDQDSDGSYHVTQWDIVNVSERDIIICGFTDKQKGKCDKPAKFQKNGKCFCLKHSKKQQYKVPTADLKNIGKRKIQQLKDLADKHDIAYEPGVKKADLVDLVNNHIKNNCFQPIHETNASKTDLVSIGYNIKYKFDQLFSDENVIDYVIIENQISPIANRMKTIQGMIAQYFIMSDVAVDKIEFVAASNKLKDCDDADKSSYKARKQLGIKKCLEYLTTNNGFTDQIEYFDKHKKQDDLADSFLQGMWFITERLEANA